MTDSSIQLMLIKIASLLLTKLQGTHCVTIVVEKTDPSLSFTVKARPSAGTFDGQITEVRTISHSFSRYFRERMYHVVTCRTRDTLGKFTKRFTVRRV